MRYTLRRRCESCGSTFTAVVEAASKMPAQCDRCAPTRSATSGRKQNRIKPHVR